MPCSICKQQGHNKRSCPHANTFVSDDKDCCVCLSPIKTTNRCTTKCGHNFCLSCFFDCVKRKPECPICRTKFNYSVSSQVDKLKREYDKLKREYAELVEKLRALEETNAELEKTNAELYQVKQRQHNNLERKCKDNARLYDENNRLNRKMKWYNMQTKRLIEKIVNDFQSTYKKLQQEIYST